MARAAVKAKQQARAKAQPAKTARTRGRRRHSGGGNPNQQLFFVRLRRGQKWLYALLAVVFAATFAGVGVGSGGGSLSQLWTGIFGGGGSSISKAQGEIKDHPAKGYRDLANAYESHGDNHQAISALQSYLAIKKKDAEAWAELGSLEQGLAQTYATRYQNAQQASQLADPSTPIQPTGPLAQAVGTNAAYQTASQQAATRTSQLFQQATTALNQAVTDFKHASKLRPRDATVKEELAAGAESAGNYKLAVNAWQAYLKLYPNSPLRGQVEARLKQDRKAVAAASAAAGSLGSSGAQKSGSGQK
jgi:tetratricopeptide (TPR) repeat protein